MSTNAMNNTRAWLHGYLLAVADQVSDDLARSVALDAGRLAGYCQAPHHDRATWPDLRCTRHAQHFGDHGAFPSGPGLAAVAIQWHPTEN